MASLKFTDGEEFNLSGELHTEHRYDGWHVVGDNKLIPVDSQKEGLELIKELTEKK